MRYLSELIDDSIAVHGMAYGDEEIDIAGITADSRAVEQGFMFVAVPGAKDDGRKYIPAAVKKGAAAVMTSALLEDMEMPSVPLLLTPNPRRELARVASRFYPQQPQWIGAVTGTDGKTSVAHFFQQMWRLMGVPAASIGTLGVVAPDNMPEFSVSNTTPDPVALHKTLEQMSQHHINHVAMEASSHGLDQHRLDGVNVKVAGFTNLSRDHMDYHHTEEAYFHAKTRLFTDVMQGGGVAVLNADDSHFAELETMSRKVGHKIMSYGTAGKDMQLLASKPHTSGQKISLKFFGNKVDVDVPLIGGFQVMNILCAAGMAVACGAEPKDILAVIPKLSGVPGRMEGAAVHPNGAAIYVDYAHTPGGLASVLKHVRPHVDKKLVVVFGCGGDRDKGKRPQMGKIAAELADKVYVTDDNPRTENAETIRKEVLAGCPTATQIASRADAIATAIGTLEKGDVLVIAGKGHEQGQIVGSTTHPFDDGDVARKAVKALKGARA